LSIATRTNNSIIIYEYLAVIAPFLSCRIPAHLCRLDSLVFLARPYTIGHKRTIKTFKDKMFDCTALLFTNLFSNKIKFIDPIPFPSID